MSDIMQATTLRLPVSKWQHIKQMARAKNLSVNALMEGAVDRLIAEEQDKVRFNDYTIAGEGPESNVDYAWHAQSQVVVRDPA